MNIATPQPRIFAGLHDAAFTVVELIVLVGIIALLAATQLPALTQPKSPVNLTQCLNNLRRMGQATMLYKADNNDCFPFGERLSGANITDPTGWPMQLLHYMGGYHTNIQPTVYLCPRETDTNTYGWAFKIHYRSNRQLLRDTADTDQPIRGSQVRVPAKYWMFIEKGILESPSIRPGGLANPILFSWNVPPGSPSLLRHNGGTSSAAADGHVEWLRLPRYEPGRPAPSNFLELGDCASGQNPASSWVDNANWVKLYSRETLYGFTSGGGSPF